MTIHIGERIKEVARQKRLTVPEMTEVFGNNRSPSYTYRKHSLPVDFLWRISEKMNHNFFADLHPVVTDNDLRLQQETATRFRQEKIMELSIRVEFPASMARELGMFLMHANALGLKMGFRVGESLR
ncbi:hypothetical protein [Hufsiella ginkgonis]|uniref:Uncharacterized protein n=1 Tax=Hufsiella ginkgonis TaxID=2695274 RepID=A0A7K1Y4K7_9SPHI|nr:hypothetical protein [Hufsiella ginkgonis]MXV17999.1 hypothetical protein [Hufsiella ginkgonis]